MGGFTHIFKTPRVIVMRECFNKKEFTSRSCRRFSTYSDNNQLGKLIQVYEMASAPWQRTTTCCWVRSRYRSTLNTNNILKVPQHRIRQQGSTIKYSPSQMTKDIWVRTRSTELSMTHTHTHTQSSKTTTRRSVWGQRLRTSWRAMRTSPGTRKWLGTRRKIGDAAKTTIDWLDHNQVAEKRTSTKPRWRNYRAL